MSDEIKDAKEALEAAAQTVADGLPDHIDNEQCSLGVQFPYGVIRSLASQRRRWPYLDADRQRTVACAIQLCDVNRFHLNVWRLGLTAGSMWEWHCTLPVIAVIETLMYEFGRQNELVKDGARFKKIINTFQSKGVIRSKLRDDLQELRDYRNGIHLYLREQVEMHEGKPRKYNDAVRALHKLERSLTTYWNENC